MATGGSQRIWDMLSDMDISIVKPVPSLFTFNITDPRLSGLQGIAFETASVRIVSGKFMEEGPLLITHWGLSGPAILKLSSRAARELNDCDYRFRIMINYLNRKPDDIRVEWQRYREANPKRTVHKYPLWNLPNRFWQNLLDYIEIEPKTMFSEISKKQANKLIEELTQGLYAVSGKSTFKEEFVTAGGVSLSEIDLKTFESKRFPGLFFAGEVLDIDGMTGGFNFQACWSEGYAIAQYL
jgi:hypothetical protein